MATEGMPSSRHAEMMRRAISPRLAIRIFLNMPERNGKPGIGNGEWEIEGTRSSGFDYRFPIPDSRRLRGEPDGEQLLAILDRLPVARIHLDDLPFAVRPQLCH